MRFVLILILALAACTSRTKTAEAPKEQVLTLLVTADLWGQLEPCGCSADMRGGLDRMAAYVEARRGSGPTLLVDAGDALFDRLEYAPDEEVGAKLRAETVAAALRQMGLSAKAVFEKDALPSFAVEAHFPKELLLRGPSIREAGGLRVGLLPWEIEEGPERVAKESASLRSRGADVVVVLAHGPRARLASQALSGPDLVIGSHLLSLEEGEKSQAVLRDPPIFFTQARGQSLLEIELRVRQPGAPFQVVGGEDQREKELESLDARIRTYRERAEGLSGEDAAPFLEKAEELELRRREVATAPIVLPAEGNVLAYRFVPITEDREPHPQVRQLIASYDEAVAEANLRWARENPKECPTAREGEAAVVGQATCATCHPAAQAFWETTKHAKAYGTLEAARKQFDLSCVTCHVTGWDLPGGPCRVDAVDERKNVGCESCHGAGSLHSQAPSKHNIHAEVREATCKQCHEPEHSPHFDFESYRSRILGPGHGLPLK